MMNAFSKNIDEITHFIGLELTLQIYGPQSNPLPKELFGFMQISTHRRRGRVGPPKQGWNKPRFLKNFFRF